MGYAPSVRAGVGAFAVLLCAGVLFGCASGGGGLDAGRGRPDAPGLDAAPPDGATRPDAPGGEGDAGTPDAPPGRDAPTGLDAPLDAPVARDAPLDVPAPRPDAPDASTIRCGDGIIDAPERCDDGNTASGDGCRGDCADVECGGADRYEDPVTHHCYWRSTSVVSRGSAVSTCASGGGYLIRWADRSERDAAYAGTLAPRGGRVWIGLQRVSGIWTWDDGTPSSTASSDFRSGEPSGDGTCAEWGPANSLNDIPCSERRDMVCEREPAGTPR